MNDREIGDLIRALEPGGAPGLEGMLREAGQELLEEIMSGPEENGRRFTVEDPVHLTPGSPRSERKWSAGRGLLVAAAVLVVVAAAVLAPRAFFDRKETVAPAAPVPSPTSSISAVEPTVEPTVDPAWIERTTNPWILFEAPGWELTYLNEEDHGPEGIAGQATYEKGESELEIYWNPGAGYQNGLQGRTEEAGTPETVQFLGGEAALFEMPVSEEFELLALREKTFLVIRGSGTPDRQVAEAWLGKITQLAALEWYAAMPESVVVPYRSAEAAAQVLEDVPLPPGFEVATLATDLTSSYSAFGAKAVGAVTCAWLDDYEEALTAGDDAAVRKVDKALSGAADWKFFASMDEEDAWDDAIVEYATKVAERQPVSYRESELGCH